MAISTFDPKQLIITWGEFRISGFAPGTFVNVERNEDSFTLTVGSDGEGARARSNDNSGRVTLTLLQTSLSNQQLSQALFQDELTCGGVRPLLIRNIKGTDLYQAETSWLMKPSSAGYSSEIEPREWVLESDNLRMNVGSGIPSPGVLI